MKTTLEISSALVAPTAPAVQNLSTVTIGVSERMTSTSNATNVASDSPAPTTVLHTSTLANIENFGDLTNERWATGLCARYSDNDCV